MVRKIILGSQTASKMGMALLTAKVVDMVVKITKRELNPRPIPRFNPIPPRIFLDDNETPIRVIINTESGKKFIITKKIPDIKDENSQYITNTDIPIIKDILHIFEYIKE